MGKRLKAKELRKKSTKDLLKIMEDIDLEIMKFKAGQNVGSGDVGGLLKLPSGKVSDTVDWGLFRCQKRNKATILTILNERRRENATSTN